MTSAMLPRKKNPGRSSGKEERPGDEQAVRWSQVALRVGVATVVLAALVLVGRGVMMLLSLLF